METRAIKTLAEESRLGHSLVEVEQAGLEDLPCLAMIEQGGVIMARNAWARRITGTTPHRLAATSSVLLDAYELDGEEERLRFDCLVVRRHGPPMAVHGVAQRVLYEGKMSRLLILMERETEFNGAGLAGGTREAWLVEDVLDATPEASVITHDKRVLHVNREFSRLFGYDASESVGQDLVDLVVPEGRMHEHELILHSLRQNGRASMETKRRTRSGEEVDVCVQIAKVRLGGRATGTLVTYRDIRKQKQEEARLRHSARHDALTGLANRSLFLEAVGLTLARLRRRPDRSFAVVFLDLDDFKQVNDKLGHAAGDALLLQVADQLTRCLRPQDTVARFGGDEFALLLDESGGVGEVEAVAARIQGAIRQEIDLGNGGVARVSASIGIAIAVPGYESAEEILLHADSAMYSAKAAGGGRHMTYRWK